MLRSIFDLGIANIAIVPVGSIIEFRKKNKDLLAGFLTSYRSFLTELQLDPRNYRKLVKERTQKIVEELHTINMELLLLNKSHKFKWLERMSDAVFQGAKGGAIVALWNLLASPLLMVGELGHSLLSVAGLGLKDLKEAKQLEQALIFKGSSGYLWKIKEEFK